MTRLNEQRYFCQERSFFSVAVWSLARGPFFDFCLGATMLAFLVRMLESIDWIPALGNWAARITEVI